LLTNRPSRQLLGTLGVGVSDNPSASKEEVSPRFPQNRIGVPPGVLFVEELLINDL